MESPKWGGIRYSHAAGLVRKIQKLISERSNNRKSFLFDTWPRYAARHRWRVLLSGLLAIAALIAVSTAYGGDFVDRFSIPGTDSQAALDVLQERFPQQAGSAATIVVRSDNDLNLPESREAIHKLIAELETLPGVVSVVSPYDVPGSLSPGGNILRFDVQYAEQSFEIDLEKVDALFELRERVTTQGFQVELGGPVPSAGEIEPPGESELIGLGMAMIILLLAFGSVVAMGLPVLTALLGLVPGFLIIGIISRFVDIASFTPQFASMIGIGVGIDYALLISTRFREGLSDGLETEDAIALAMTTAGRSVVFAGTVVVIALLGLWTAGLPFIGWVATAAAIVVATLVVVAIVLLPAILSLLGPHINKLSVPFISSEIDTSNQTGVGARLSKFVRNRPLIALLIGLAIVITLASPVVSLRLGSADAGGNPESSTTRRAYDLLSEGFGPGFNGPILISLPINDPSAVSVVEQLPQQIREVEGVAFATAAVFNPDQTAAIITVIPISAPQDVATGELVARLRDILPNAVQGSATRVHVGGQTAAFIDVADKIATGMPVFIAAVLGLSVVLLMIVFRSILIPIKAALMIAISVGVGFGVVVAVFQWGWLGGFLGVDSTGPVESFLPMMLFAVLFGLSMDYEVFLVSRMHEEHIKSGNNGYAVARGQAVTFRVIVAAGLIMSSVFFSFALADFRVIKEFGLGLGTAIIVDALVVRMLLVPALMHLFGERTWWFPRWLDRLLPKVSVGEDAVVQPRVIPVGGND